MIRTVSSFLCLLVVAASAAFGSAPGYGPWHLGMTPGEVQAVTEFGPYEAVASTGGLETRNARFEGKKITISFVFDADGLYHIQLWAYEGEDYRSAVKALHRVYKYLSEEYGALTTGRGPLPAGLSKRKLEGRIPDEFRSNDPQLDRLQRAGKIQAVVQRFHIHLKLEASDVRIYASLIHSPELGLYYVFLYFKSPNGPRRTG